MAAGGAEQCTDQSWDAPSPAPALLKESGQSSTNLKSHPEEQSQLQLQLAKIFKENPTNIPKKDIIL